MWKVMVIQEPGIEVKQEVFQNYYLGFSISCMRWSVFCQRAH